MILYKIMLSVSGAWCLGIFTGICSRMTCVYNNMLNQHGILMVEASIRSHMVNWKKSGT